MKTGLVTCMYNGLSGTKFGGRNRETMYKDSLSSIAKSGLPIICFVFPDHQKEVQDYFNSKNLENVTVVGHDILSEDFHDGIMAIKHKYPERYLGSDMFWQARCPEIMWGKTRLISSFIRNNPQLAKLYWIDAGLSSSSILRHRYFPNIHLDQHYTSEGFFTQQFFDGLDSHSNDGLVALMHTRPNNDRIPQSYNSKPYTGTYCAMIGGLFGGNVRQLDEFCAKFEPYITKMLENGELFSEEGVYTGIFNDNRELFAPIYFDTFYNEDWPNAYCEQDTSFVQVLEKFLEK